MIIVTTLDRYFLIFETFHRIVPIGRLDDYFNEHFRRNDKGFLDLERLRQNKCIEVQGNFTIDKAKELFSKNFYNFKEF